MTKEELKQHCEKQVKMCEKWANGNGKEPSGKIYEKHKLILDLIKELEQQPCDDCVSREAVLDLMQLKMGGKELYKAVYDLPPVSPTRKVGKWIYHEKSIPTAFKELRECSCCHCYFRWEMPRNSYCPNCGAEMVGAENE